MNDARFARLVAAAAAPTTEGGAGGGGGGGGRTDDDDDEEESAVVRHLSDLIPPLHPPRSPRRRGPGTSRTRSRLSARSARSRRSRGWTNATRVIPSPCVPACRGSSELSRRRNRLRRTTPPTSVGVRQAGSVQRWSERTRVATTTDGTPTRRAGDVIARAAEAAVQDPPELTAPIAGMPRGELAIRRGVWLDRIGSRAHRRGARGGGSVQGREARHARRQARGRTPRDVLDGRGGHRRPRVQRQGDVAGAVHADCAKIKGRD